MVLSLIGVHLHWLANKTKRTASVDVIEDEKTSIALIILWFGKGNFVIAFCSRLAESADRKIIKYRLQN